MKGSLKPFEKRVLIFLVSRMNTTYATLSEVHRGYLQLYPRSKIGKIFLPGVSEEQIHNALQRLKRSGLVSSEEVSYLGDGSTYELVYQPTKTGREKVHAKKGGR